MSKKFEIDPSGHKGAAFEMKGFQERNLQILLETLSKKETQKSLEALSKINKDEWKAMSETATSLNNFIVLGGQVAMFNTMTESIKETITLQIDSILSPLQNEINQAITNLLTPFLNDILGPVINDLTTFLSENQTGAGVGGIVGSIIGIFLPGGVIWTALGALMGSIMQSVFTTTPIPEATSPIEGLTYNEFQAMYAWYFQHNPSGSLADFFIWAEAGALGFGRSGGFQDAF